MTKNHRVKTAATILVLSLVLAACGAKGNEPDAPTSTPSPTAAPTETAPEPTESASLPPTQDSSELIAKHYRELTLAGAPAQEAYSELKKSMEQVQPAQADELIRTLEQFYEQDLPKAEKSFEEPEVQQELSELDWPITEQAVAELKDEEVRTLVENTVAGGYKVETAEGYYFPVVDYGRLLTYSDQVTISMKAYLDLRARESDAPSAKDAALVISWDELASRLLASESYLVTFPDTPERQKAEYSFLRYLSFYFIGLSNTPIFDYETFAIRLELQTQYEQMAASHGETISGQFAKEFLSILEESKGQLFVKSDNGEQTDVPAVKKFRDKLQDEALAKLPAAKNN
ncbi:hypothetical protein B1A99_14235 [Cohnella sp. CIP 111063]|uniref:hypothetical protein n=1 Tax=unclassified Cohnella TaxID=2636738 RepID=UPI000B8C150A|nr:MULTISPECIES: hypothetical protein [unclassified Cohnella]OXS58365.1 hypothetical protein B1A99_14235 [Cohnella sp. CIP 111063]PRX71650.1 hypothetical protein B0G52_108144 [Cohnella sp. SGD-V74]